VLVIGQIISDSNSLDPAQAFEFGSVWADAQVYDTLVDFSRGFTRAVPRLALSWTVSSDGKTYTFRLRTGAKFHSGATVDARAIEFSIRRVFRLNLTPAFIVTDFIKNPTDVVAVGNDQVRVTFNQSMPEILMASVMANPVTSVVDPALVQRNATATDPMANAWVSDHDAGSGPFRLIGWSRNLKIELQAFEELGIVSGYFRGRVDDVLMRVTDMFMAFPRLILAMAIAAALKPTLENVVIAISLAAWPAYARLARSVTLGIREENYIEAARSLGASHWRILGRHVLPGATSPAVIQVSLDMGGILLTAAGLGFIGFGAQPPTPEWGLMISEGRNYITAQWWVSTFPGLAISLVVLGFNLLGDGIRDVLDPRMRGMRH